MPSAQSIQALFDNLPSTGTWAIKVGDPAQVRYSDSLVHLWMIMELMTLHRSAGCQYVEIFGRGSCYSRFFTEHGTVTLSEDSSVVDALCEEVQSISSSQRAAKIEAPPQWGDDEQSFNLDFP